MKKLNIVVEGNCEEAFVNNLLAPHFAPLNIYASARRIRTGWDKVNNKPAKGGLFKYAKFRNDVKNWIKSDGENPACYYSSMLDLYAFPKDDDSPYTDYIQNISNCYKKVDALEQAISKDINHPRFIPYIQLHEFEALILVDPDKLLVLYPESETKISRLIHDIGNINPEEINESKEKAPSKRIIQYLPDYKGEKAQIGPLVAEEIGMIKLRSKCPHFNSWIIKLESL